jgi:K+-sensing histidine kinase KdpD
MILIEKKKHKKQLEVMKKDIIFQNKLLESFSHELRTPLNCTLMSL